MRIALPLALLLGLGACATGPQTVDTAGPTVTYDFERDEMAQADARAEEYCAQYQMEPEVVDQGQDGDDYRATYRCTEGGGLLGGLFGR
jgi:hypothetical protein